VDRGREVGSLIAVDITQGAGLIPVDVMQFDFAASTSLKWLCGMPGAGFGFVNPALLPKLEPPVRGWFSQTPPLNWDLESFSFASDARRFGTGTPSLIPYIASLPGLEWVHSQPAGAILDHNRALCKRLFEIADDSGLKTVTPRPASERGGSLIVEFETGEEAEFLRVGLREEALFCDRRGGRLRWSPGATTTVEAVDRLAQILPALVEKMRQQPRGKIHQ
jgi:selenocysteine lyase/cysteine desulfurase